MKVSQYKQQKHTTIKDYSKCTACYREHGAMLPELHTYDWAEAFVYAEGFIREDVKEILFLSEGENDWKDWIGIFKLENGKFAGISSWCDYTGWD